MQNFDELAEGYLGLVEKQKVSEGKAVDSFSRGDMETCYVSGAQSMEQLQEGREGTFGQAIGSLKHGFLVRRKGWNGYAKAKGRRVKQMQVSRDQVFAYVSRRGEEEVIVL